MEQAREVGSSTSDPLDEQTLSEHARRFFEGTSDLLVIVDMEGSIIWANEAWERKFAIAREEMLGDGFVRFIHPDDRGPSTAALAEAVGEGIQAPGFENRYRSPGGGYRDLLWSSVIDQERGLIYAAAKDITELKRSRDELAQNRSRLTEAQRISGLGSWTYDPETGAVTWSDGLFSLFRVDREQYEPSYEGHMALVHPEDEDKLKRALTDLWETGKPYSFDYRIVVGDDEVRVLHTRARIDTHDDGSRVIAGVCQDVTEPRQAEAELARSVSIHRATLEATADGILVVDTDGQTVTWNQNFVEMWQLPADVVRERQDEELLAHALEQLRDPDGFLSRVRDLYANPKQESFDVLELKDGRVFERYSAPQRLDGAVVGRVWSFRDVTDRLRAERENRALEARLQQSHRLESLGRLAGGIAHDFNNHLVAILNYAALAAEHLPKESPGHDDVAEVVRAAERASAMTRELVSFSRQEMVEPRPLLLNSVVADSERMLRAAIGEEVELRVELGRDMPAIEADPSQLERVLMNLAINARDAMPEGGTLLVKTETVEASSSGDGDELDGSVVRLTVRDDGTGMTEDVAARALEPFFTTKPSGEANGLGLATVYGIVNQSGGRLAIDSVPGRGTTMTVELPASSRAPEAAQARTAPEEALTARGAVLVVEDEAAVRRLTARLLRDAGFRAIQAADGEEALAMLAGGESEELSLLLTDIVMPRMSGRELAERVRESRPDLPVLFMSGYTDDVVVRHGVATAGLSFVAKPFTGETLLTAVGEAIEAGARPLG